MEIRKAKECDFDGILRLLVQVNQVHADGRPDIFKSGGTKYTHDELRGIISNEDTPVWVAVENDVLLGYAFCRIIRNEETVNRHKLLELYIDDLCVDEVTRGKHVGKALYEYVVSQAKLMKADQVTLHVWECNQSAKKFYEAMGMKPMYTAMEEKLTYQFNN